MSQEREIGLVEYVGAQEAAVLGMVDLFGVANQIAERRCPDGARLRATRWHMTEAGAIECRDDDPAPARSDGDSLVALILPPSLETPGQNLVPGCLVDWLTAHHAAGVTLAAVCAGAFVLADTGLLDGRAATTHWMYAELFRERYPRVELDVDRLVIDSGDIVTAGGAMSWTDLALRLVDRYLGPAVMIETARALLIDPADREQRYYSAFLPSMRHGDAAILRVQHRMHADPAATDPLAVLATEAGL